MKEKKMLGRKPTGRETTESKTVGLYPSVIKMALKRVKELGMKSFSAYVSNLIIVDCGDDNEK